ncbi:SDR family NAD(P)-dependent oxidoreductase [Paraburkholderia sp. NPDC080076]|uniref:SDR family NAD(P)-dependent oxidoreductase n=1 Tax=Paraburkholderia sp. NPDC080076 TaxID=3390605 RepID=UPI003D06AEA8
MIDTGSRLSVVLGGANGIGEACCRLMAERGWQVAVADVDSDAASKLAADIGGKGYCVDVRSLNALEQLALDIEREQGSVYSLVVSSGAFQERFSPDELPIELWQKVMQVNLDGTFYANRVFGTRMARQGKGSIVNVASAVAYGSSPLHAYGPSKAAIVNLTRTLAGQWGKSGVRVNSVSPGATAVARVLARPTGRYATDLSSCMALGRRVEPLEVAEGIEFLSSDRASAITGVDLLIDAGLVTANGWSLYGGVPDAATDQ